MTHAAVAGRSAGRAPRRWTGRVLLLVGAAGLVAGACSGGAKADQVAPSTSAPPSTTTSAPASTPTTAPAVAPLTGLPLPPGRDLSRPALAVKIDNHPDADPQVGLESADVVFEERVEGITRFLAVFWSKDVDGVGPIRSARTSDINLLDSLGQPLLAWSGGNDGVRAAVADSDVVDVGVDRQPTLYYRDPDRLAPHNLMSSTADLVKAAGGEGQSAQAPVSIQAAGTTGGPAAGAAPVAGVQVDLQGVVAGWARDPGGDGWLRYQRGARHVSASGEQIRASNVVVLGMDYEPSPADASSPEAQSLGEGPALVLLADGTAVEATWQRNEAHEPFTLLDTAGTAFGVQPGTTWIELPQPGHTSLLSAADAAGLLALR